MSVEWRRLSNEGEVSEVRINTRQGRQGRRNVTQAKKCWRWLGATLAMLAALVAVVVYIYCWMPGVVILLNWVFHG